MPIDTLTYPLSPDLNTRVSRLRALFDRLETVPTEWLGGAKGAKRPKGAQGKELEPLPCTTYRDLISAWRRAMRWRQAMDDVLSVMLAVSLSTEQIGDQLFLMCIGDAGSGKTKFCDGMLVSKSCYPLEHLSGFHSGWKGSGADSDEDFSLLARINRKTLITPEGDVLMSSPKFVEIMSQQRRIFDGTSGASFKNRKEDMRYTGLRTPWIIAGTPALLDTDQSRLGDRFLKVVISPPDEDERAEILKRVAFTALRAVQIKSDGTPQSQLDENYCEAYQLTGGYIDWLKFNTDLIASVDFQDRHLLHCAHLGEFVAYLRARPNPNPNRNEEASKEEPTRLTHQFVRLAACLAVVLNKSRVDDEVIRRVRKVALDTARGQTMRLVSLIYSKQRKGEGGIEKRGLALHANLTDEKCSGLMRFLNRIGATKFDEGTTPGMKSNKYVLTPNLLRLYREVHPR